MSTKHPQSPSFLRQARFAAHFGRSRARGALRRAAHVAAALTLGSFFPAATLLTCPALLACSRDPAELEADDRQKLALLLAADAKVDGALAEAERLDRHGKGEDAAKLVEGEATRALGDATALLTETKPLSPWGASLHAELGKLFSDRKAAMPGYASSLRSSDAKVKLEAALLQAGLEKRALAIAAATKATRKN